MAAKVLTQKFIDNVKAPERRREYPDALAPGLYFIVQPISGARSWAFRYKLNGNGKKVNKKLTLGGYERLNHLSLAEARLRAKEASVSVAKGHDPARKEAEAKAPTFGDYTRKHFERPERRHKAGDAELRRTVEFDCADWENMPLASIGRGAIKAKLDAAFARSKSGSAATARKLYAALSAIFQLGVDHEVIEDNPVKKLSPPSDGKGPRSRVLSDGDELVRVWKAAGEIGGPFGNIIRLLILTGARRDEIADAKAEWLDLDKGTLTIPRGSMKTRAGAHVIYLTPLMRDVLADCPTQGFLFTARVDADTSFKDWSRCKRQLDKLSGVTDWRIHDLRRSAKTNWQKLRIDYEVRQTMSAHAVPGSAGVYERHDWAEQCKAGFEAWSARVRDLVTPPPPNVLTMKPPAKARA